jgi:hypothetical protein
MWHGTPIFSPDLKEAFWTKYNQSTERGELVYIKYLNGNWTSMQYVPFGNLNYFENNPFFSFSGDTLFFVSRRPGGFIFRVCRIDSGWTEPVPLNIPIPSGYSPGLQFSIAKNGTIYFELYITGPNPKADIFKSKIVNGQYQMPENLGNIINSDSSETSPYIDPYEKFLLFASKKPGGFGLHDIYISSRRPDSTWNNPVNLGLTINSGFEGVFPCITPDSLYFFLTTAKYGDIGYNPYWISANYIYNLIGIKTLNTEIPSSFSLYQNYPNPFNPQTKIKFELPKQDFVIIRIFDLLGREVAALVNQQLKPGTYEVNWDASDYPSGVYFYEFNAGNNVFTKKMILLK